MTASRIVWSVLVPFCVALAIVAVTVMVRANTGGAASPSATANAQPQVVMADIAFAPTTLAVRQGAEVVFDNKDVAPHTVTADDGSIDSGILNPGKSFRLVVSKPFTYHCEVHPSMKAKVVLEG